MKRSPDCVACGVDTTGAACLGAREGTATEAPLALAAASCEAFEPNPWRCRSIKTRFLKASNCCRLENVCGWAAVVEALPDADAPVPDDEATDADADVGAPASLAPAGDASDAAGVTGAC